VARRTRRNREEDAAMVAGERRGRSFMANIGAMDMLCL
jgi:hypothetical protein